MFTKETENFSSWYHDLNFYMRRNVFCLYHDNKIATKICKDQIENWFMGHGFAHICRGVVSRFDCFYMHTHVLAYHKPL